MLNKRCKYLETVILTITCTCVGLQSVISGFSVKNNIVKVSISTAKVLSI